jgi:hypothetical protein
MDFSKIGEKPLFFKRSRLIWYGFLYWTEAARHGRSAFTTVRNLPQQAEAAESGPCASYKLHGWCDGPILGRRQPNPTTGVGRVSSSLLVFDFALNGHRRDDRWDRYRSSWWLRL